METNVPLIFVISIGLVEVVMFFIIITQFKKITLSKIEIRKELDQAFKDKADYESKSSELVQYRQEIDEKIKRYQNTLYFVRRDFEELVNKYIILKITLLEINKPKFEGSSEFLYKIDDLRIKKEAGDITIIDYLRDMEIFFKQIDNQDAQ